MINESTFPPLNYLTTTRTVLIGFHSMTGKKFIKIFQRALARYNLYFFYWLFGVLPYWLARAIGHVFMGLAYMLVIRQKSIAHQSLRIAFGKKKSPQEINSIMRRCFLNVGQNLVEMIYSLSHPEIVPQRISVEGQEHLDKALSKGNGVIAVTAHFGNFPLMMLYFSQQGFKTSSIIRPARDEKVERFLLKRRKESGLKTIYAVPRKKCVNESIKSLRNNEILFIPIDQNFGAAGGVYVDFFGQKAATATGPAVFASRTNAAIIPMFIIRQSDDTHKIIIEKPIALVENKEEEQAIVANMTNITGIIEKYIREYPHEWGWMHRRWKSRPYFLEYVPHA